MKKSVVILIALIYVISIVVVGFYGMQFKIFEEIIPTEKVEILTDDGYTYYDLTETDEEGNEIKGKYVIIQPNEKGEYKYQIRYKIIPDDATEKGVTFAVDENKTSSDFSVSETGLVTIFGRGKMAKIFVESAVESAETGFIIIIAN